MSLTANSLTEFRTLLDCIEHECKILTAITIVDSREQSLIAQLLSRLSSQLPNSFRIVSFREVIDQQLPRFPV